MELVFAIILLGFLGFAGWTLYTNYRASTQTGWHRYLDAAEGSATILWSKFVMIIGSLTGAAASAADYFNEPAIADAIKSVLKPEYVAAFTVLVAVITIWARKRTL